MTEREKIEKELLLSIIMESSRWRLSEGDDRDCIRIECETRLAKYMGISPEVVDGREQSVVERGLAKAAEKKKKKYKNKTKEGRHRIFIQGRRVTVDLDKLVKVPHKSSPTGYKYELAPGVTEEQLLAEAQNHAM